MVDETIRQKTIGGSEVGAIIGCDASRDGLSVWLSKHDYFSYRESKPTMRMIVGKCLERGLIDVHGKLTGRNSYYYDQTVVNPKYPHRRATPDGLCHGELRGVEVKVVASDQRHNWGHTSDEIPERVQLQVAHYMGVLEYPVWDVIALIGGEARVYTIERDLVLEAAMNERIDEWHRRFMVGNERPPMTGSWQASQWLQTRFAEYRPDIRQATDQEIALLEQYAAVRQMLAEHEDEKDLLENRIKEAIGESEGLKWPRGRFTWRRTRDSKATDWEALAIATVTNFIKDPKQREALIAEYTKTRPGIRRIRFVHNDLPAEEA
jgi:predicted phage-related endonuclease